MTERSGVLMMKDPLPNTLSALIKVAVHDSRKLDRDQYEPNFYYFHLKPKRRKCMICDAGAVIAGTLRKPIDMLYQSEDFVYPINYKLWALDRARRGLYSQAVCLVTGMDVQKLLYLDDKIKPSPYMSYRNWEEFGRHMYFMEGVAQQLEALGY